MFSKNSPINQTTLTQLLDALGSLLYTANLEFDSRRVGSNSIFCAYPGNTIDGRQFIEDAIKKGAKFILWENGINFDFPVANFGVENLKHYIGLLASIRYNNNLSKVIGVTGTNGKTSIAHWLSQLYTLMQQKVGIIGTTGAGVYPDTKYNDATTPDPLMLQQLIADFSKQKIDVLNMEVSSHAIHQGRVNGITYTTAIFTNLTLDHLDYHHDMESYYQAKRDLFFWHDLTNAVINTDDEYGRRLFNELKLQNPQVRLIDYGVSSGTLKALDIKIDLSGMKFSLSYNGELVKCQVSVIGRFNIYNLLAVTGALIVDGYTLSEITLLLNQITPVCGRMDTIVVANKPLVVIDFSHTPDSLKNALSTLKEIENMGKLYCVFGCGGNRDSTKRPLMGDIASTLSDYVIVTSDNPRFEEPEEIIRQITIGIKRDNFITIPDRTSAIKYALKIAHPGDIVLIAGKGHETYQEVKGIKSLFSDFDVARKFLISKSSEI
jgi:UDP-N-acetylmuramoyl-L-alanyl-D-glutamate--2,6-diaminopimelate ligase